MNIVMSPINHKSDHCTYYDFCLTQLKVRITTRVKKRHSYISICHESKVERATNKTHLIS